MCAYVKSLAELVDTPVRWLWDGWLPAGKLVLLDGEPGTGKSTLACELAARLSRGDWGGPPVPVLLINGEDGEHDTTGPRLRAAGADSARVRVWNQDEEPFELPRDLDKLREAITFLGARLVVIDPLSAFLGRGVNMNNDQSIRRLLSRLARLAEEVDCTVLMLRHLRKQGAENPLHRGLGSIGLIAAVRVAWLLGYHPGGEERRVLAMTKCNLGPVPAAKVFRNGGGKVTWGADEEWLSAADVVKSAATGVARWLGQVLEKGPRKSDRIKAEAAVLGISERTLWRAKRSLRVVAKAYFGRWYWCLPGQDPGERYGGLEPMEDLPAQANAVLGPAEEPLGPVDDVPRLGPVDDDGPRLTVPAGASQRQILRQASRVLRAGKPLTPPASCSPRPPSPLRGGGREKPGNGPDSCAGAEGGPTLDAAHGAASELGSHVAPRREGGASRGDGATGRSPGGTPVPAPHRHPACTTSGAAFASRSDAATVGSAGDQTPAADAARPERSGSAPPRSGEGPDPSGPGSRRFDPAPAGTLDLVLCVRGDDPDWVATVMDRLLQFQELVQGRVGESARFDSQLAWTGVVGAGRLRLVLAPVGVPPDGVAALAAWAREGLSGCESARLAA